MKNIKSMIATERTRLLHSNYVVTIPKHLYLEDEEDNEAFLPLTYDELKSYINDPWWRSIRSACFASFWVTIIVIFTMSCIISILGYGICHAKTFTPPIITPTNMLNSNMMITNYVNHTLTAMIEKAR